MKSLAGTGSLTRFALRRDRVILPTWIAIVVLSAVSSAQATVDLYPTEASRVQAAAGVNDVPALIAFYGRIWDAASLGALSMMKMSAMGAALLGVLAIMLVIRHTRREEEAGRLELVSAGVVGRAAPLTAALIVALLAMVSIGVLTATGLTAVGLPAGGSWAFGLAWCMTGLSFAAVAAITAQLTVSARAAVGWAIAAVGIAYVLRALGDVAGDALNSGVLSWLSPIGWGQQMRAFAGNRWWVLLVALAFIVVAAVAAFALESRRDLGAGLLPDRDGPARASGRLASPLGLAWRLHRGTLVAWGVAFLLLGAFLGAISADLGPFLTSPEARDFVAKLGGSTVLADAFQSVEFGFMAVAMAALGVSIVMRLHAEEEAGHAEQILSTSVSRTRWLMSHVLVAVAGTSVMAILLGLASGLATGVQTGRYGGIATSIGAAAVYLPAIWLVTGLVIVLFGLLPRWTSLAWGLLVAFLLLGEFGRLLDLPDWVMQLSPFAHIPQLPGAAMSWTPIVMLALLAALLVVAGGAAFRRRDLMCS
jgi:ABC-2 type transport system permease protein